MNKNPKNSIYMSYFVTKPVLTHSLVTKVTSHAEKENTHSQKTISRFSKLFVKIVNKTIRSDLNLI